MGWGAATPARGLSAAPGLHPGAGCTARDEARHVLLAGKMEASSTLVQVLCHVTQKGVQGLPAALFSRALLSPPAHSIPVMRDPHTRPNWEVL